MGRVSHCKDPILGRELIVTEDVEEGEAGVPAVVGSPLSLEVASCESLGFGGGERDVESL